jgi:hypothetical protein
MTSLVQAAVANPQMTPMEALRSIISQSQNMPPSVINATLQQAQGQRTPSLNGPSQFASPLAGTLGLPPHGSPHLGNSAHASPVPNHPPGPTSMPQGQGGAGGNPPAGPNVNASPSVNNKRRRPSAVKLEGDDGGGSTEVNGSSAPGAGKVKASPRVTKRQKGQAAT